MSIGGAGLIMFVCLCTGAQSRRHDVVANGAKTSKQIAEACGAGGDCGRCRRTLRRIIEAHSRQRLRAGNAEPLVEQLADPFHANPVRSKSPVSSPSIAQTWSRAGNGQADLDSGEHLVVRQVRHCAAGQAARNDRRFLAARRSRQPGHSLIFRAAQSTNSSHAKSAS